LVEIIGLGVIAGAALGLAASQVSNGDTTWSDNPECSEQYEEDLIICRQAKSRACYAQAMERLAACNAGRPIPPLLF
jgi:hypothetical protein